MPGSDRAAGQRGQRRGWPEQSGEPDRRSRSGGYPRPQRQAHARFAHHLTLGVKRAEAPGRRGRAGPAATWRRSVAAQPRAFRPNEGGAAHGSLPARPEQPLNTEPSRPAGPPVPAPSPRPAGKGRRAQRKRGERSREVSGRRRHPGPSNGEQRPTGSDPPPPRPPQGPRRGRRLPDGHRARLPRPASRPSVVPRGGLAVRSEARRGSPVSSRARPAGVAALLPPLRNPGRARLTGGAGVGGGRAWQDQAGTGRAEQRAKRAPGRAAPSARPLRLRGWAGGPRGDEPLGDEAALGAPGGEGRGGRLARPAILRRLRQGPAQPLFASTEPGFLGPSPA